MYTVKHNVSEVLIVKPKEIRVKLCIIRELTSNCFYLKEEGGDRTHQRTVKLYSSTDIVKAG